VNDKIEDKAPLESWLAFFGYLICFTVRKSGIGVKSNAQLVDDVKVIAFSLASILFFATKSSSSLYLRFEYL